MSGFGKLLYYSGYPLLISPSQALDIKLAQVQTNGELARVPVYLILALESSIRLSLLLILAVTVDYLVGNLLYEMFRGDTALLVLIVSGAVHISAYYLLLVRCKRQHRTTCFRIYRLVRNLCYAPVPGIAAAGVYLMFEYLDGNQNLEDVYVLPVYLGVTVVMAILGVLEFFISKRLPVGLDTVIVESETA